MALKLTTLEATFTLHRLAASAPLPDAVQTAKFVFIARSANELSIVCPADIVLASDQQSTPWRCFALVGPLEFTLVGILGGLTRTLAESNISVFAVSTFDTDYLLVPGEKFEAAQIAFKDAGYQL